MAEICHHRGVPKEKSVDHNRKRVENLSKANAVKKKVIHLDQLEFLPIFPYSELLIWILPVPRLSKDPIFIKILLSK